MASFRGHIGFGLLVAVFVTGIFVIKTVVTGFAVPSALFVAIVIGSFMPDLDSDTSIVFSMIFSLFSALVLGVGMYALFIQYGLNWQALGIGLATILFGLFAVLRPIFKKLTKHRGMFHSIPAAAIAGLVGYQIVLMLSSSTLLAVWFGIGFCIGYLAHLILDELHAGINLDGKPFHPNKMIGTALKLFSGSVWATITTYALLVFLLIHVL